MLRHTLVLPEAVPPATPMMNGCCALAPPRLLLRAACSCTCAPISVACKHLLRCVESQAGPHLLRMRCVEMQAMHQYRDASCLGTRRLQCCGTVAADETLPCACCTKV